MKTRVVVAFVCLLTLPILARPIRAFADDVSDYFEPQRVIGQWAEMVDERPVDTVTVVVKRQSQENDATLSLRFKDRRPFEGDSIIRLADDEPQTLVWHANGERPQGQPLVLSATGGRVLVESVLVQYLAAGATPIAPVREGSIAPKLPPVDSPAPGTVRSTPLPIEPQPKALPPVAENQPTVSNSPPAQQAPAQTVNDWVDGDSNQPSQREPQRREPPPYDPTAICRTARIIVPQIRLVSVTAITGLSTGRYRLQGIVEGNCIEEAGYYESGQLVEVIGIRMDDNTVSDGFTVIVRSDHDGEIRARSSDGSMATLKVDQAIGDKSWFLRKW
jgi:hypothetical protein